MERVLIDKVASSLFVFVLNAEDLQDESRHEFVTKEQRAEHSAEDEVIVELTFIGADEDHQEQVVEHRPGRLGRAGEAGAHDPQGQPDHDQRNKVRKRIEVHLKRPEHAGIPRARVIILRRDPKLEVFVIIIILPTEVPAHLRAQAHREPGQGRLEAEREGLRGA